MTKLQPFQEYITDQDNKGYRFIWIGSDGVKKYITEIIVDELNDNQLATQTCECPDCRIRQHECKHIKCSKVILKYFKKEWYETPKTI